MKTKIITKLYNEIADVVTDSSSDRTIDASMFARVEIVQKYIYAAEDQPIFAREVAVACMCADRAIDVANLSVYCKYDECGTPALTLDEQAVQFGSLEMLACRNEMGCQLAGKELTEADQDFKQAVREAIADEMVDALGDRADLWTNEICDDTCEALESCFTQQGSEAVIDNPDTFRIACVQRAEAMKDRADAEAYAKRDIEDHGHYVTATDGGYTTEVLVRKGDAFPIGGLTLLTLKADTIQSLLAKLRPYLQEEQI